MPSLPFVRRWPAAGRALLVLALVLGLHVVFLAKLPGELDFDVPPPQNVMQAELFKLPAPITLAAQPAAPAGRPPRAITPQASLEPAPSAAPAPPAPEPKPKPEPVEAPVEAPAPLPPAPEDQAVPPATTPTGKPRADAADGESVRLEALGAVLVDFPKYGRIVSDTAAKRGVIEIDGITTIEWQVEGERYRSSAAVADRNGTIFLQQSSEGEVRPSAGLAPLRYTEKTYGRAEVATNFQWDAGKVTFSSTAAEFPLVEGIQDRLSFLAQLALIAEAFPSYLAPGASVALQVAGPRDVRIYNLRVLGWETVATPGGSFDTLKLDRQLAAGERDVRVQLWLAPALRWLPVRSFTILPNGDTILTQYREGTFAATPGNSSPAAASDKPER
jgi:hypothetical protein